MKFKKLVSYFPYLLVFLFASARAFLYYKAYLGWNVYLGYDDAVYATLAKKLLAGDFYNGFHPYWNSGYPIFTIPFYLITQSWEKALILVSMVSSVLLILVVFLTLKKNSLVIALITSFILSVSSIYPRLTLHSGVTESLYILFFWLSVIYGFEAITTRLVRNYLLTGIFFGITYFIRTEVMIAALIFVLIALGSYLFQFRKKIDFKLNRIRFFLIISIIISLAYYPVLRINRATKLADVNFQPAYTSIALSLVFFLIIFLTIIFERNKENLIKALGNVTPKIVTFILIFCLINLPYFVNISFKLGKPTISGKYSYLASGHPFSPEKDRLTTWAQDIWATDLPDYNSPYYDSARIASLYIKNLENSFESFSKLVVYYIQLYGFGNTYSEPEMYLVYLGIISGLIMVRFRRLTQYLLTIWFFSFVYVVQFMAISNRYLAFSFPMIALAQAIAIYAIGITLRKFLIRINFAKVLTQFAPFLVIIFFIFIYFTSQLDLKDFRSVPKIERNYDQKLIGEYLKSQGANTIMARTEGISFYSGTKLVYVPAATPEVIVQFAKVWDVDFIVSRPVESSWDYMREIVNPNYKNPDITLAHKYEDGTIIWKVAKDK